MTTKEQNYTLFPSDVEQAITTLLTLRGYKLVSLIRNEDLKQLFESNDGLIIKVKPTVFEKDKWSPNAILAKVSGLVVGLQMFLEHVNSDQIEELTLLALQKVKPYQKTLLMTNLNAVYGYSDTAREFAQILVGLFIEMSQKNKLIPKTQLSVEQVLEMDVRKIFSVRTFNSLCCSEIYTISELMNFMEGYEKNLLRLRGFGKTSLSEVKAFIQLYKL